LLAFLGNQIFTDIWRTYENVPSVIERLEEGLTNREEARNRGTTMRIGKRLPKN
jgi:hypothetical protein